MRSFHLTIWTVWRWKWTVTSIKTFIRRCFWGRRWRSLRRTQSPGGTGRNLLKSSPSMCTAVETVQFSHDVLGCHSKGISSLTQWAVSNYSKLWWNGSSDRSFFLYCDIHLSETDRKNVKPVVDWIEAALNESLQSKGTGYKRTTWLKSCIQFCIVVRILSYDILITITS